VNETETVGPDLDPARARGVMNPAVVDLIELDQERGEVVLVMLEPRPWSEAEDQIDQLEAKLNSYLAYVFTQGLARDYPQYADKTVRFQLECAAPPGLTEEYFLAAARKHCEADGVHFVWKVQNSQELAQR